MIIQGIFPFCLTPELYAAKPEYVDQLAAFVRSRPQQPLDAFIRPVECGDRRPYAGASSARSPR